MDATNVGNEQQAQQPDAVTGSVPRPDPETLKQFAESDAGNISPANGQEADVNMEAAISAEDVMRAGGFGAKDDIGSLLPTAIDSTDFEASLRDARDFEGENEAPSHPGLGWKGEKADDGSKPSHVPQQLPRNSDFVAFFHLTARQLLLKNNPPPLLAFLIPNSAIPHSFSLSPVHAAIAHLSLFLAAGARGGAPGEIPVREPPANGGARPPTDATPAPAGGEAAPAPAPILATPAEAVPRASADGPVPSPPPPADPPCRLQRRLHRPSLHQIRRRPRQCHWAHAHPDVGPHNGESGTRGGPVAMVRVRQSWRPSAPRQWGAPARGWHLAPPAASATVGSPSTSSMEDKSEFINGDEAIIAKQHSGYEKEDRIAMRGLLDFLPMQGNWRGQNQRSCRKRSTSWRAEIGYLFGSQNPISSGAAKFRSGRKNNKHWTPSEVKKLVKGLSEYGVGNWVAVKRAHFQRSLRTAVHLKDKWRDLLRACGIQVSSNKKKVQPQKATLWIIGGLKDEIICLHRKHAAQQWRTSRLHLFC